MQLRELLATPGIAAALGFLLGVALIAGIAWSRTLPSDPSDAISYMMFAMLGTMLVSTGVLLAYVFVAPDGFVWFGVSLGVGFLLGLGILGYRMMRQ